MHSGGVQESGVRSQESGVRSQESGVRSQKSGVRSQESGVRSQESGVRSQESGVRSQESGAVNVFSDVRIANLLTCPAPVLTVPLPVLAVGLIQRGQWCQSNFVFRDRPVRVRGSPSASQVPTALTAANGSSVSANAWMTRNLSMLLRISRASSSSLDSLGMRVSAGA